MTSSLGEETPPSRRRRRRSLLAPTAAAASVTTALLLLSLSGALAAAAAAATDETGRNRGVGGDNVGPTMEVIEEDPPPSGGGLRLREERLGRERHLLRPSTTGNSSSGWDDDSELDNDVTGRFSGGGGGGGGVGEVVPSSLVLDSNSTLLHRPARGLTTTTNHVISLNDFKPSRQDERISDPNYSCYRTVKGMYQFIKRIAAKYPKLAEVVDIGTSINGSPLRVLKLTNQKEKIKKKVGEKGILLVVSGLHPRELAPVEVSAAFAQYMVKNYKKNADVRQVLDRNEVHLLIQANPDGRRKEENQLKDRQRKNARKTGICPKRVGGYPGVDLNRNFGFHWGFDKKWNEKFDYCEETYPGDVGAFSEPETLAIKEYAESIFPTRQRREFPTENSDMPFDNEDGLAGVFFDFHSYGKIVVWPWVSMTKEKVPNFDAYLALGHKFCSLNNYIPLGSGIKEFSYRAPGGSIDWTWSHLAVPSFIFMLGHQRYERCAVLDTGVILPNIPVLFYAAKVSRAAFAMAKGPDVTSIKISPSQERVEPGGTLTVMANVSDSAWAQLDDEEEEFVVSGDQNIQKVRLYVGGEHPHDTTKPAGRDMYPTDGNFDSVTEEATLSLNVDSLGLKRGKHMACVRATDMQGYDGPVTCVYFKTA